MTAAIGAIGLGTSIAGGALSAYGAVSEGNATAQAYNYRAQMSKINSQINLQNSDYALNVGETKARQYGMSAAQTMGKIKTTQAGSGLDVNSGTAKDVQNSQLLISQMDQDQIRKNAGKTAYDYRVQADNDLRQAGLDEMSARNAKKAGMIKAAGSIISSASSVSSKWLQGRQTGLWGSDSSSGSISLYGPDMTVTGYA
jgi:hypothetical protein